MALGSTQPLTEMSTRCISWSKGGRCVIRNNYCLPPSCAVVMKSGNLIFLEPSGPLQVCNGTALPFFYTLLSRFDVSKEIWATVPALLNPPVLVYDWWVNLTLNMETSRCSETSEPIYKTTLFGVPEDCNFKSLSYSLS